MKTTVKNTVFFFVLLTGAIFSVKNNQLQAATDNGRREAFIHLKNETGVRGRFKVIHIYTGDQKQESPEIDLAPNEVAPFLVAKYRVGFWTTGVDNWRVVFIPYESNAVFKKGVEYRSGVGGGFDQYKVHTLRNTDCGKQTTIFVREKEIKFESPTGKSSTYIYIPGNPQVPIYKFH